MLFISMGTPKFGEMTFSKSCTQLLQIGTATTTMTALRPRNFSLSFFHVFLLLFYYGAINLT